MVRFFSQGMSTSEINLERGFSTFNAFCEERGLTACLIPEAGVPDVSVGQLPGIAGNG